VAASRGRVRTLVLALAALVALTIPGRGQTAGTAPAAPPPAAGNLLSLLGGRIRLDPALYPRLGPARGAATIAVLFDYTCDHCRTLNGYLGQAVARYGDRLTIILMPSPLDAACNPAILDTQPDHKAACYYAKFALALWQATPVQFAEFHRWLLEPEQIPLIGEARRYAEELAGKAEFERALAAETVWQGVAQAVRIYGVCDAGDMPKILMPRALLSGNIASAEKLFSVLEAQLGITPAPPATPDTPAPPSTPTREPPAAGAPAPAP